jgi:hypothetical protein
MTTTKTCPECGKTINARRSTRVFCGAPCRKRAHRTRVRVGGGSQRPAFSLRASYPIVFRPGDASWRPSTPHVALLALHAGVPLDFLHIDQKERALLLALDGRAGPPEAELLLDASGRDPTHSDHDHLVALYCAVALLRRTLTEHPLVSRRGGRPRKCKPYRPVEWDWKIVLNWYLPWIFRRELRGGYLRPEHAVSLDAPVRDRHGQAVRDEAGAPLSAYEFIPGFSPDPAQLALARHPEWLPAYQALAKAQGWFPGKPPIYSKPRGVFREQETLSVPKPLRNEGREMDSATAAAVIQRLDRIEATMAREATLSRIELRQEMQGERLDGLAHQDNGVHAFADGRDELEPERPRSET